MKTKEEEVSLELSQDRCDTVDGFCRKNGYVGAVLLKPETAHVVFSETLVKNKEVLDNAVNCMMNAAGQMIRYSGEPRKTCRHLLKLAEEMFEEYFPEEAKRAKGEMAMFDIFRNASS